MVASTTSRDITTISQILQVCAIGTTENCFHLLCCVSLRCPLLDASVPDCNTRSHVDEAHEFSAQLIVSISSSSPRSITNHHRHHRSSSNHNRISNIDGGGARCAPARNDRATCRCESVTRRRRRRRLRDSSSSTRCRCGFLSLILLDC
jgi:hypothetical protein